MNFIEQLNSWMSTLIFKNSVRDYAQAIVTFLGLLLALSILKRFLMEKFEQEEIAFAYPTQTLFLNHEGACCAKT